MGQRWESPPRLQTKRLVLEGHRADDLETMMGIFGDAGRMRHIGGVALSRKEVFRNLLRYRGAWPVLGYGTWAFRDLRTGRLIGQGGFFHDERGLPPPYAAMPEAGWILHAGSEGQGLAAEAMQAALGWLDEAGCTESLCLIDPENTRSLQLASRLGFAVEAGASAPGDPALVLVRRAKAGGLSTR